MKKFVVILSVVFAVFLISTPSFALLNNVHNNYDYDITNQGGQGGNATGGSVTNSGNSCVVNSNNAKNYNTDINNNTVKNYNINNNSNKQAQGQTQGQVQGQGQNQGQMNNWTQIYEDKRDHIRGPEVVSPDVKFQRNRVYSAKIRGDKNFYTNIKTLTWKQAKSLMKGSDDIEVIASVLFEKEFSTDKVHLNGKATGEYMGTITLTPDGDDVTSLGMIGAAGKRAMELGATGMNMIHSGFGVTADGSAINIGLGGGASIMGNGDSNVVAPNGGLGWGSATSANEARPEMVFELYFDEALVK